MNDLKKTLALTAVVFRNGQRKEIPAEEIVTGDVVEIEDVSIQLGWCNLSLGLIFSRAPSFLQTASLPHQTHTYKLTSLL